jgi:hypothetical protein
MAVIPRKIYRAVEGKLFVRDRLVSVASDRVSLAKSASFGLRSPIWSKLTADEIKHHGIDPTAIHGTGQTDGMHEVIEMLEAESELCHALKWAEVFSALDEIFTERNEGKVAVMYYTDRMKGSEIAEALGVDRQTIRNYRDTYVAHCALLAAEKGLVTMTDIISAGGAVYGSGKG